MRYVRRVGVVVVLGQLVLLVAGSIHPAGALSCAPHPSASPEASTSGTEVLATGDRFFDRYDGAVIGTVTAIDTVGEGGPDYGATTISMAVVAVLGEMAPATTMVLSASDPGWLNGYPFEVGRDYFVPVLAVGPQGQRNYTHLCDPIAEVGDVQDTARALEVAASASDIPFASGSDNTARTEPATPSATRRDCDASLAVGTLIVGVPLASGGAFWCQRRRSRRRDAVLR